MVNQEIAKIFSEIGEYLEMNDDSFRAKAYERVATVISGMEESVDKIYEGGGLKALEEISGVGESIGSKIEEYLKTGKIKYFEELKKKTPVDISTLTNIEGLGPKKIKALYRELGIKTVAQLEKAARAGKIRKLAGFGEKTEVNILKGIEFLETSGKRFILPQVFYDVEAIKNKVGELPEVLRVEIAGSARRKKETIGDLDILAIVKNGKGYNKNSERVMDFFSKMPEVKNIYSKGTTRSSVKLNNGMNVDLRILREESYGAGLMYFTGSKEHNIELRRLAISLGYKLNEYGLFEEKSGKMIAGKTEEEIYNKLGLTYITPEMRENTGEIALAKLVRGKGGLPKLIGYDEMMGDLQVQTNWSDGENSIEECAEEAIKRGLKYILITDHSKRLTVANGLDEKRIVEQGKLIDNLNAGFKKRKIDFVILKGIECDILKNGEMDIPDRILKQLDIVGGSVHSYFNLPVIEQTKRIIRAMNNPNVDIIFHLTGRIINQRKAIEIDFEDIVRAAILTKTTLEIDSFPDRLDLKDDYIRKCVDLGVKLSIDSDAHAISHFKYLEFGIAQARRGWATRKLIVNAWPVDECLRLVRKD